MWANPGSMQSKAPIIGITGGIGSGKSYCSNRLAGAGCKIIDCDKINHSIMVKGTPAYHEIVGFFGQEVLGVQQEIDRKKLGAIVFGESTLLAKLEEITHKYIKKEVQLKLNLYAQAPGCRAIVIDAPLLIESGLHNICDIVVLVYADADIRLKRVMKRDHLEQENVLKRMANQMRWTEQIKYAHRIIDNSYDAAYTDFQLNLFLMQLDGGNNEGNSHGTSAQ